MLIHFGEVHVWTGPFRAGAQSSLWSLLNATEQARAQRFVRDRDRHRYVWARGQLRCILANYVGVPPQNLEFGYIDRGKPSLVDTYIQFNLSHSGDWVVYGVTRDRAIGVDIEEIQPPKDWLALAERFFDAAEVAQIRDLAIDQQTAAFFKLWTRKEACLKATGEGLQGLQSLQLDWQPDHQRIKNSGNSWEVRDLAHIPGYAGAIALQINRPLRSSPVSNPTEPEETPPSSTPLNSTRADYDRSNFTHFSLPA